jgi:hypothetical protein
MPGYLTSSKSAFSGENLVAQDLNNDADRSRVLRRKRLAYFAHPHRAGARV